MSLRKMALSPQHRLCRGGWRAARYFGVPEVLVAGQAMVNGSTIRQADPVRAVTYVHFLLDGHQIVRGDGVLSESFFPSPLALGGVDRAARAELLRLFPGIDVVARAYRQTARSVVRAREAVLVG